MNRPTIIETKDPFRAAYLLRYGEFKKSLKIEGASTIYTIAGEKLFEEDYRYRTGYASVNPLLLKASYELLMELSAKEEVELVPLGEDELDLLADEAEEEIDLLTDEEEA
jgi:hypothetical protein